MLVGSSAPVVRMKCSSFVAATMRRCPSDTASASGRSVTSSVFYGHETLEAGTEVIRGPGGAEVHADLTAERAAQLKAAAGIRLRIFEKLTPSGLPGGTW